MASIIKEYIDFANISDYDELIKQFISDEDAAAYKTILLSADGKTAYFYKDADATTSDTPDMTISNGTRVTINGVDGGTSTSFYAPTTAGTNGQVLVSNGSGAPSWGNIQGFVPTYDSTNHRLVLTKI